MEILIQFETLLLLLELKHLRREDLRVTGVGELQTESDRLVAVG